MARILDAVAEPLVSRLLTASLLLSAGLLASQAALSEQRFLGSPDGSYKLTLDLAQTQARAEIAARLQRLLIPNRTLWQLALPAGAGFRLGYVNDAGHVIVINDALIDSDVVLVVVNSQSAAVVDYRFSQINSYLQDSHDIELSVEDWRNVQLELRNELGVAITSGAVGLLVRFQDGALETLRSEVTGER